MGSYCIGLLPVLKLLNKVCTSVHVLILLLLKLITIISIMLPLSFAITINQASHQLSISDCSLEDCASQCPSEPFTGPHGTIVSFNYPSLLPIYFSCTWTVIAKPGRFVHLEFLEFDISCLSLNSLIVGETSNTSSADSREEHICGGEAGSVITAGDTIVLSLSTGLQQKSTGFSARYTEQGRNLIGLDF